MRRYLIIILAAILAIVIIGGGILIAVNRSPKLQNAIEKQAHLNGNVNTAVANSNKSVNTNSAADPDPALITYVARNFAEQYGTNSSDDNYAGTLAATTWGTANFNTQLRQNLAARKTTPGAEFHGTVTKALVVNITQRVNNAAVAIVSTQRVETIGAKSNTYTQNLQLSLVKDAGRWKVAAATWQPQ